MQWNVSLSDGVKKQYREMDLENFTKMYPDITYADKYVLWIDLGLYWTSRGTVEIDISIPQIKQKQTNLAPFMAKSENFHDKFVCRHLYPNKNYHTACMKNGRKYCDAGVILYFDTFEKLSEISEIIITWRIKNIIPTNEGLVDYVFQVIYNISYQSDSSNKIYTLSDCAMSLYNLIAIEDEDAKKEKWKSYVEKYQGVYLIREGIEKNLVGPRTWEMWDNWTKIQGDIQYGEQFLMETILQPELYRYPRVPKLYSKPLWCFN